MEKGEIAKPLSPERWAINISHVLNAALGTEHFPIKVIEVAKEYSRLRFPADPITYIAGDDLPSFDGALLPSPDEKKGWGIIYNSAISSAGRINFTLAHEFGHYLLHRERYPKGFRCSTQDVTRWDSEYGQIEYQANKFAASLLMPLDDYKNQINPRSSVSIDQISACAVRYDVSLLAASLRWIEYTERRAVLVVSRDDYILWARSSQPAMKTKTYFRTSGAPVSIPVNSIAANRVEARSLREGVNLAANIWFKEPCNEITIFSEQHDFTISLLQLSGVTEFLVNDSEESDDADVADQILKNHGL
jgi:Zn-dependent peptidase ImmA (M78 family)